MSFKTTKEFIPFLACCLVFYGGIIWICVASDAPLKILAYLGVAVVIMLAILLYFLKTDTMHFKAGHDPEQPPQKSRPRANSQAYQHEANLN